MHSFIIPRVPDLQSKKNLMHYEIHYVEYMVNADLLGVVPSISGYCTIRFETI